MRTLRKLLRERARVSIARRKSWLQPERLEDRLLLVSNPIVVENLLPGNPSSEWNISGAGDASIQGFAADISIDQGQTIDFKINTDATDYRLDIYRMGYYGNMGARKVATIQPSATLPQVQPACLSDLTTGLVDCGNWSVSASWTAPADATSGIYFAKLVREDAIPGSSHIVFIVRDDDGASDLLFQTSDTTWQAYNGWGGTSLYYTNLPNLSGRGFKVSYNRPFLNASGTYYGLENWVFHAEYPMVMWLESNGYNVSYFTDVDSDRRGAEILEHSAFLSVGHDEYWSAGQRSNVEAARDAGVDLAFFSGNEVFWKTRWETSIDGSGTPYRTMVCYKETHAGAKIDPLPNVWTGTWRDPRFSPPADGGRPENALTGTLFRVNGTFDGRIWVPEEDGKLRLWRNTSVANLLPGQQAGLTFGSLGFEWDEDFDNGLRPAGLFRMSSGRYDVPLLIQDYGSSYAPGTATHSLTMYRAPSGALVFGAGTIQWSWGLYGDHTRFPTVVDPRMQQATVNLFADMGVQPGSLQPGLVPATASSDTIAPTTTILSPLTGATVQTGSLVTIRGTAADVGGVVAGVEFTTDGGVTRRRADGRGSWSYVWTPTATGSATIQARAVDDSSNLGNFNSVSVTVVADNAMAPLISAISVSGVTPQQATIAWTTDEASTSRIDYGTSPGALTMNVSNLSMVNQHSLTLTGLLPNTTYFYRVSSTDEFSNTGTSPVPPATPNAFSTLAFLESTLADFSTGTLGGSTYMTLDGDGELILMPTAASEFSGTVLDPGWNTALVGSGGSAVVAGGTISLEGARVTTDSLYSGPGRSVEFLANFNAPVQYGGFLREVGTIPWAVFITLWDGDLYATTNPGTGPIIETVMPVVYTGEPHHYRIDWKTNSIDYWIDGVLLASHTATIAASTRPLASDENHDNKSFAVDWIRMSPYANSDTFQSRVFDAGQGVVWKIPSWTTDTPTGTSVVISARVGDTPTPDATWTAFSTVTPGATIGSFGRYMQYRADLTTATTSTPVLKDISIAYQFLPSVAFALASFSGNESLSPAVLAVSLAPTFDQAVTVNYAVTGGTAAGGGADYTLASGTLTFDPGESTKNISIPIFNDTLNESDETIQVTLSSPTNATLGSIVTHTYTILDDDPAPSVAFNVNSSSGGEQVTPVNLSVSLSAVSGRTVTVAYAVTGGSAAGAGVDYTLSNGTLTFNPGDITQTIPITIVNDTTSEPNETIQITLSAPVNATPGANTVHTYTILDDDLVAFQQDSGPDRLVSAESTSFFANVQQGSDSWVLINDTNATSGTAMQTTPDNGTNNDTNYVTTSSHLDFKFNFVTTGTHYVWVRGMAPSPSGSNDSVHIGLDGLASTTSDRITGFSTTYGWSKSTMDGPVATFNVTSIGVHTVNVWMREDGFVFDKVVLTTNTNFTPTGNGPPQSPLPNDPIPSVAFSLSNSSGSEATTPANLGVTLSTAYGLTVTVNYAMTGGTATGGGVDYTLANGTVTFNPGETTKNIPITIANDTLDELNETIQVTLSAPTNATLGANTVHTFTILDNDAAPNVAFAVTSSSGSEATTPANLTVSLSGASALTVTVNYAVTGGTATGGGTDYTLANGSLTFTPGQTSTSIPITIVNDALSEANETVQVTLSAPTNATLGANTIHTYTILDNEPLPAVAFAATSSSGDEATTPVSLTVSLSAASGQTVTVNYAVSGGTATAGGVDYTLANGTLSFSPGQTSQNIPITIVNDALNEANETIQVTLSGPAGATLGANTIHTYTVLDNDPVPSVSFALATSSGSEATTPANLAVSLAAASGQSVTVNYAVTGGTAAGSGVDFTLANGTVTFNPGETTKNVAITVANDTLDELDETIQVTLSAPTNATLGATTVHTFTILDNDAAPNVAFAVTSSSGSEATTPANLTVSLSSASGLTVTVNYAVTGGTATGGGTDYTLANGSLTFTPGQTSTTIPITIVNDALSEANETVQVTLSAPTNATLGANTVHTYTILDNDQSTVVAFASTSSSGGEATTPVNLSVTLSAASAQTVTVNYAVSGGTATAGGVDYTLANGTLNFSPGQTSQNIPITIVNDTLDETNETIQVTLSAPTNATLSANTIHTFTILDNDATPSVSFASATSSGSEATTPANLTVSLSAASGQSVTVNYAVTGGTATGGGVDFTLANGTLTFTPGQTSKTLPITILNDTLTETNETIQVTLSAPTNATLGTTTLHTYTILDNDPAAFQQDSGSDHIVSMESSRFDANVQQGTDSWVLISDTNATNGTAMQTTPNDGTTNDTNYLTNSSHLDFRVNFVTTGTHYVWIRGMAPSSSGSNDSIHVGLDGLASTTSDRITGFSTTYGWSKTTMDGPVATFNVTSTGLHTLNAWMREDGFIFDKIVLTTNTNFTPTGNGPAESPRSGSALGAAGSATQPASEAHSSTELLLGIDSTVELHPGVYSVFVDRHSGEMNGSERARIRDAIAGLNNALAPFDVKLKESRGVGAASSDIRVTIAASSPCGGVAEDVLGCEAGSGDVIIVQGWNWYSGSDASSIGSSQYDFETVVTHELGHALGLEHSSDPTSVMYAALSPGATHRLLPAQSPHLIVKESGPTQLQNLVLPIRAPLPSPDAPAGSEAGRATVGRDEPAPIPVWVDQTGPLFPQGRLQNPGLQARIGDDAVAAIMDDMERGFAPLLEPDLAPELLADLALVLR